VIIEELQRQVVELTQHLAVQNIEMYHDIESPSHNPILVREQHGRDKEFIDGKFQHGEDVEDHS